MHDGRAAAEHSNKEEAAVRDEVASAAPAIDARGLPQRPPRPVDQSQQLCDRSMRFNRMAERLISSNPVVVLAAELFAIDDSAGLEIRDHPLNGPLGDSDLQCHLSQHQRRISRQEHQHVRMIRQKRPMGTSRFRQRCD